MRKAPTIYTLKQLLDAPNWGVEACVNGRYVPARPEGFFSLSNRWRAAWLVFTGRADAVLWPGQ